MGAVRGHVRDLDRGGRARDALGDGREPERSRPLGAVGGNMEGKEVRFGTVASGLYAASTTGTSTGSVNASHDSFTPLGGAVPLVHMMLGEVSPGGTGAGLYAILVFALLSVFIAGLMVGRTPEYVGKKIQATEMKLVVVYLIVMPLVILGFSSISVVLSGPLSSILNPGPHGLSEVVYAFTSAANNNGSAFGGLTGNTDWYNTTLGLTMLFGRFFLIVPVLAIAGSLARKQPVPATAGTFPTNTPLFAVLLLAIILIVVGLTYFPVVSPRPGAGAPDAVSAPMTSLHLFETRGSPRPAALDSFRKLDPRRMARNPVMFVTELGAVLTTFLFFKDIGDVSTKANVFAGSIAAWLWFTVLFANFAEAMAEGRGKAQAAALRTHADRDERAAEDARRSRSRRCRARSSRSATRSSSRPAR